MWNWLRRNHVQTKARTAHWLPANENCWGLMVLDCTAIARGTLSVTSDKETADTYARLRRSNGAELRREPFDPASRIACNLTYKFEHCPFDGPVFKSRAMEEKWDIYCYAERFYFCRSWSGKLVHRATFRCELPILTVVEMETSYNTEHVLAMRELDYLVKSHVLSAQALHPLPRETDKDAEWLARSSFSSYGRMGLYGTMEETIGTPYFLDHSVSR